MLRLAALRRQASTSARAARAQKPKKAKAQKAPSPASEIKLTLAPRGADRDAQILRSTLPSFLELVQKEKGQEELLDVTIRLRAPVAERVLDLCTAAPGQPRGLVHLLVRLDSQVQFSRPRSKEALRMLRQRGDAVDLRQLRRSLQQREQEEVAAAVPSNSMPPLLLDVSDVNDTISLCMQRGEMDEAVKWFITMQDSLRLTPSDSTCGLLLPALIRRRKWEALFYLLAEMRVLGLAVPPRAHDLLLAECEEKPHTRWRYVQRLLAGLLEASRADLQKAAAEGEVLVLRNIQRSLGVLRSQAQHVAVVRTWAVLRRFFSSLESTSRGLLWDREVVLAVGISAVVLGNGDLVAELVRGPGTEGPGVAKSFQVGEDGAREEIRRGLLSICSGAAGSSSSGSSSSSSSSSSSGASASIGARCGLGLSWLLAHGEPGLALELHASLGQRGEALADLLLVLSTSLSDGSLRETRGTAHLEAAGSIVRESLGDGADKGEAALASSSVSSEASPAAGAGEAEAEAAVPRLSAPMAAAFIALFGKTQDAHGVALVLLHCSQQSVLLSEEAFLQASQTLLQHGDLALVLRLLEGYLLQLDSSGGGSSKGSRSKFASCKNPLVFSPALSALAQLGELDTLVTILLKEMPRRGCRPSPLLYTIAVDACRNAGRLEEGFRLFELSMKSEGMDRAKSGERNDVPVLVDAVLQLCAQGRMGREALKVVAWVDDSFPSLSVLRGSQKNALGLVIAALASPQCITLLPPLLQILRSGQQPLAITRRVYTACLAAALVAGNQEVYQILWEHQHDGEIEASRGEIEEEAKAMAAAEGGLDVKDVMEDGGADGVDVEPEMEVEMELERERGGEEGLSRS